MVQVVSIHVSLLGDQTAEQLVIDTTVGESQLSTPANNASLTSDGASTLSKPKFRHIRSQRRDGSKSESSAESQESELTAVSSGEASSAVVGGSYPN